MLSPIRILIVDDSAVVRRGLSALLSTRANMEVIGEAADGFQAVDLAHTLQPDVVLLDLAMPRKDGMTAIREIKQENPEARILVLTGFSEDEYVFAAIKAGAKGYLLKGCSTQELIAAIRAVFRGEGYLDPTIAFKLLRELRHPPNLPPTREPLIQRELEVLKLVAQGLSDAEIAERLGMSEQTVGTHRGNILAKLHQADRTQTALKALGEGTVS